MNDRKVQEPVNRNRPNPNARAKFKAYKDLTPVSGASNVFPDIAKDPNFFYYWPVDISESGAEIIKHKRAGYVMVDPAKENLGIGTDSVYSTEKDGSVYRVPARSGGFHYCMKIPMELKEMYDMEKEARLQETENSAFSPNEELGQYGKMKAPKRAPQVKVFGRV